MCVLHCPKTITKIVHIFHTNVLVDTSSFVCVVCMCVCVCVGGGGGGDMGQGVYVSN